ncbi:MAG: GFA family protein [Gammaproteobacteria bacterium]|nr:GFA family protein [Gammaproteobacteria bacterium]
MVYQGSCHCGKIGYEVEAEPGPVTACNCSMCRRRGHLLWFLPRTRLKLKTPESDMRYYTFNQHHIKHYFCPNCGCATFGMAKDKEGKDMVAVNVRCLEGVDIGALKVNNFDGRSL